MKKRRSLTVKSESSMDSTVDKLLSLSRNQRLLTLALQMPQVQSLFRKVSSKKRYNCLFDHYTYWKHLGAAYHEQKERIRIQRAKAAVVIQCLLRKFLARVRVRNRRKYLENKQKQAKARSAIQIQCLIRKKLAGFRVSNLKSNKKKKSVEESAVTIQRVFRGYLGRGTVILLNRNKLIKQIRSWSNGVSSNILHISGNNCFFFFTFHLFLTIILILPFFHVVSFFLFPFFPFFLFLSSLRLFFLVMV
jgi:hypothetical protein